MKRLLPLVICLGMSFNSSVLCAKSSSVDVYRTSMGSYVNNATCNVEMKDNASRYVTALSLESDKLAGLVQQRFAGADGIKAEILKAHKATKMYAEDMSVFSESLQWYDFQTKEVFWGSGYGYETSCFKAQVYWRQIVFYQTLLQSDDFVDFYGMNRPQLGNEIGGLSPQEILAAVRRQRAKEMSETAQTQLLDNHAASGMDKDFVRAFNELKAAILANDAEAVADFISFPIENSAGIADYDFDELNRDQFIKGFKEFFTDFAMVNIVKVSLKNVEDVDGHYEFTFRKSEPTPDPDGGWFEGEAGCIVMAKVDGKWKIVQLYEIG